MPSQEHPDDSQLRAWLSLQLDDQSAMDVENHVSDCEQCAKRVEPWIGANSDLEDKLRDMVGDSKTQILPAELRPSPPTGHAPTIDSVADAWQGVSKEAVHTHETIKGQRESHSTHAIRLPIRKRSLRQADPEPASPVGDADLHDDYQLLNVIGKGGMGVVYSARQSAVDRLVAIKMLKNQEKDSQREQLFLQEAVVTADLDHPNIVPVHELGSNDEGALFYSMKQVQGKSWSDVIDAKTTEENVDLLIRVADAVAFAHARGIIHRDLKPENVMLGRFGEVWLMDWGLAQLTDAYRDGEFASIQQLGGTPAYMPPEMTYPNKSATTLSDVYLLGAILFEIVAGVPPHQGDTVLKCLVAAQSNKIVETRSNSSLLKIAYRAMATRPEDRYESVVEFQAALKQWVTHSESLQIAAKARQLFEQAEESGDYEDYIRALFGFEQAHTLFPESEANSRALGEVRLGYAKCAARREDFDLAMQLLDPDDADHAEVLAKVAAARDEQQLRRHKIARQQRAFQVMIGGTLILMLSGIVVALWLRASALHLANRNEPSMHASLTLQSGLRNSMAALQGWVALGDPDFRLMRRLAWAQEVQPALTRLEILASEIQTQERSQQVAQLNELLGDLSQDQWWIEEVAQTPGNEPARVTLRRDIRPVYETLAATVESLLALEEGKLPSESTRSSIWSTFAQLQLVTAKTDTLLADFIENGDTVTLESYQSSATNLQQMVDGLAAVPEQLSDDQRAMVRWLQAEGDTYRRLCDQAIGQRQDEQANVALWRLRTRAIPNAQRIETILTNVVNENHEATLNNSAQINQISLICVGIASALAITLAAISLLLTIRDRRARVSFSWALPWLFLASFAAGAAGQELERETIESADVYQQVNVILQDLDLLRLEMGRPKNETRPLNISNVAPHEVFFQALTLYQKTDQLCFEQLRVREAVPETPTGNIEPADVYDVVMAVRRRLENLKSALEITEESVLPPIEAGRSPTDVLVAIMQANRQLNQLTQRQFTPSDVYQQVSLAVSYGAALLDHFPDSTPLPNAPDFERKKTPGDVILRLAECFQRIQVIADMSGMQMIEWEFDADDLDQVVPSDAYDVASLIVSELAHLHAMHGGLKNPRRAFYPGRRFPSHVYQRAGMLHKQIEELEGLVTEDPEWLKK